MVQKKDSKNRNLKQNEDQLSDGRYRYRYTDKYGKRSAIYSWKLVSTDKTPIGKKEDISLREKERSIEKDLNDGIDTYSSHVTTIQLIQRYLSTKPKLSNATKNNYLHMLDKNIVTNVIGEIKVCEVKKSDVLKYYAYLYNERKFKISSLQLYQNLLFPAFQMAVDDDIIRKNPCNNCMKDYVRGSLTSTKYALKRNEQNALLKFVKSDNIYSSYYPLIAFMLSTGCRIGEALGLTWNDIKFSDKYVDVNHQIIYKKYDGKIQYYSDLPKNKTSRQIPIQDDIINILKKHKEDTYFISASSGFKVDSYSNFVFINRSDKIYTPNTIVRAFHSVRESYNLKETEIAYDESVEPLLLPDFTPHTFRHTFCTRMAENGMDVRVLQEIMGHKNISVTMQVYNHATLERNQKEVETIASVLAL